MQRDLIGPQTLAGLSIQLPVCPPMQSILTRLIPTRSTLTGSTPTGLTPTGSKARKAKLSTKQQPTVVTKCSMPTRASAKPKVQSKLDFTSERRSKEKDVIEIADSSFIQWAESDRDSKNQKREQRTCRTDKSTAYRSLSIVCLLVFA